MYRALLTVLYSMDMLLISFLNWSTDRRGLRGERKEKKELIQYFHLVLVYHKYQTQISDTGGVLRLTAFSDIEF